MDGRAGLRGARQLVGQRLRLLGGDVETEDLDRDETIARRLVGAEHGTESADADLMQHPEGAERGRGANPAGSSLVGIKDDHRSGARVCRQRYWPSDAAGVVTR